MPRHSYAPWPGLHACAASNCPRQTPPGGAGMYGSSGRRHTAVAVQYCGLSITVRCDTAYVRHDANRPQISQVNKFKGVTMAIKGQTGSCPTRTYMTCTSLTLSSMNSHKLTYTARHKHCLSLCEGSMHSTTVTQETTSLIYNIDSQACPF